MNKIASDTIDTPEQEPFAEEDRLADKIIALAAIDPEIARNELSREIMHGHGKSA